MSGKNTVALSSARDKIERWSTYYQGLLGLGTWTIEHVFLEEYYPEDEEDGDFRVTGVTYTRQQYFHARIKWYLLSAINASDERLEEIVLHEHCHVLLGHEQTILLEAAITNATTDMSEEQTKQVTRFYSDACESSTELVTQAIRSIIRQLQ